MLRTLDSVNRGSSVQLEKNHALLSPRSGYYGDYTEDKGKYRKEHRYETLDATLCQAMNTVKVGSGH